MQHGRLGRMATALTALAAISAGHAAAQSEPIDSVPFDAVDGDEFYVRWKLEPGERFTYDFTRALSIGVVNFVGIVTTTETVGRTISHEVIQKAGNGGGRMILHWDALRVQIENGGQMLLVWDSDNPAHEPLDSSPAVADKAAVVGRKLQIDMDPNGKIFTMGGRQSFVNEMALELRRLGYDRPNMEETLLEAFTADALKRSLEPSYILAPNNNIGPGQAWKVRQTHNLEKIGEVTFEMTMTLDRYVTDDGGRTIGEFSVKGEPFFPPDRVEDPNYIVDIAKTSTITGEYRFDVDRGKLLDGEIEAVINAGIARHNPESGMTAETNYRVTVVDTMRLVEALTPAEAAERERAEMEARLQELRDRERIPAPDGAPGRTGG